MARLCIEAGFDENGHRECDYDAVNPEKTDYITLLRTIRNAIGARCLILPNIPESLVYQLSRPLSWWHDDILVDRTDLKLMLDGITSSDHPPLGRIALSTWVKEHRDTLGRQYISSLKRYYK
jgi:hypothetical protein